jgi:hypothetical protein|tara:strand:+ start:5725 stop:6012 length:288 start_codon:yes stop_codon:yes gene_type:complete
MALELLLEPATVLIGTYTSQPQYNLPQDWKVGYRLYKQKVDEVMTGTLLGATWGFVISLPGEAILQRMGFEPGSGTFLSVGAGASLDAWLYPKED